MSKRKHMLGTLYLSPVIYDKNMNKGCFYCVVLCGSRGGSSYFVFVQKEADHWQLTDIHKAMKF